LAAVASRSSLVGALLRAAFPSQRHSVITFLSGLSCSELECLAEFEGACALESQFFDVLNTYRLLEYFFEPSVSDRWLNPEDRAHKTFLVLAWLEYSRQCVPVAVRS